MYPNVTKVKSTIYSFIICMRSSLMPYAFLLRVIPCPINLVATGRSQCLLPCRRIAKSGQTSLRCSDGQKHGRPYLSIHCAGCPKSAKSNHSRTISWRYDSKNHERMSLSYFFPWNQSETFVIGMQKLILTPRIFLPPSCGTVPCFFTRISYWRVRRVPWSGARTFATFPSICQNILQTALVWQIM